MAPMAENPFTPGAGLPPPLRAGHERAARELESRLRRICAKGTGDMVVLHGPRGNGKTALLTELAEKAEKLQVATRVLTSEAMQGDTTELARIIEFGDEEPEINAKSASASRAGAGGGIDLEQPVPPMLRVKLHTLLKSGPVIITVDEAHVMPADFGRNLLQTVQYLIGKRMPLLLVLAGTPGVRSNIGRMGASFWERCRRFRISRLESEDAVRRAIAVPAERAGLPADEDALALLARESQSYPFFIQLLAAAAWDAAVARTGSSRIELRDAQAGVAAADSDRRDFYLERFFEARKQGVLPAAIAVSEEMLARGASPALADHKLMEVLETATAKSEETALSACDKLEHLGFIWATPDADWEPAIPSLCAYFIEQARTAGKDT